MRSERKNDDFNSVTLTLTSSGTRSCRFCRSGGHTVAVLPTRHCLPPGLTQPLPECAARVSPSAPSASAAPSEPLRCLRARNYRTNWVRHQPRRLLLLAGTRHNSLSSWVPSPWSGGHGRGSTRHHHGFAHRHRGFAPQRPRSPLRSSSGWVRR